MATDFFHRLVVIGIPARVRDFQQRAGRTYERTVLDHSWKEVIPLSFVALNELTPLFDEGEEPSDPLDICVWPLKRVNTRRAEARYQFQTRNMEVQPVFSAVARKFPALTLRLVTLCLDDASIDTWQFQGRKETGRIISDKVREAQWDAARRKFKAPLDTVYDNDDALEWVEFRLLDLALNGWERGKKPTRRNWWNAPARHTLEDERVIKTAVLSAAIDEDRKKQRRAKKKAATRSASRSGSSRSGAGSGSSPGRRRPRRK